MAPQRRFDFSSNNPLAAIFSLVIAVLVLIGLIYVAQFIMRILWLLTPLLIIAVLIMDYKVVWNYIQWLGAVTKRNTLGGVVLILLSLLGLPLVSVFLLGKILLRRQLKSMEEESRNRREGQLIDYEEIESEPLDLDQLEQETKAKRASERRKDDYDQFFE